MSVLVPEGLRIGAVSYLNTKPLIHALAAGSLILDVPAHLAGEFFSGGLDVALLPFFAVLKAGGGRVVDDVAIACRGDVHSVFVASRETFEECRDIYLDPSSRSSSALLRVLLAEFYPGSHRLVEGEVPPAAARLLIGDPAIRFRQHQPEEWCYQDLGALWQKHTGLPFVFAVWAVSESVTAGIGDMLRTAKSLGLNARKEIAAKEKDPEFALRYLTHNIHFDIGAEEKRAMSLFESLARKHGVLPPGDPARITWC